MPVLLRKVQTLSTKTQSVVTVPLLAVGPEVDRGRNREMAQPSHEFCIIDKCPKCGKPGHGVRYMPEERSITNRLELVIHHGINGQISGFKQAVARNYFHYMGVYRTAEPGEIVQTYRAKPTQRPDWK
jgi:hypothetical protein